MGLHTILLLPEGLREQTAILEARVKWQSTTEIAESPQVLVLFISPRCGFLVPKRVFPDPEQVQAFLQTAHAYRQSAFYGTEPALPPMLATRAAGAALKDYHITKSDPVCRLGETS